MASHTLARRIGAREHTGMTHCTTASGSRARPLELRDPGVAVLLRLPEAGPADTARGLTPGTRTVRAEVEPC